MVTRHAKERIDQRYRDNNSHNLNTDLRTALKAKRVLKFKNPVQGRVTILFSANEHFLWKVVMSKTDGAVITVLPVSREDIIFAISKNLLNPEKMYKKHRYI